jgi:hypothetical protein
MYSGGGLRTERKIKNFRRYLDLKRKVKSINEIQTVKKFFELIEVPIPDPDLSGVLHSIWNIHILPNNLRVFAFQFYNNSLATNTRLAARYRADPVIRISDNCAFCIAGGHAVPAREDFFSCFFPVRGHHGLYQQIRGTLQYD